MIEEKSFPAPEWPEGTDSPRGCPLGSWNRFIQAAVIFNDPDIVTVVLIRAIGAVPVSIAHEVAFQAAT